MKKKRVKRVKRVKRGEISQTGAVGRKHVFGRSIDLVVAIRIIIVIVPVIIGVAGLGVFVAAG